MKNITCTDLCKLAGVDSEGDLGDCTSEVASLSQSVNQFGNYSLTLRRTDSGQFFMYEDQVNDSKYYLVSADEAADPASFLRNCASEWAGNCDDNADLEMIAWGLRGADDFEVTDDFDGECKIIVEGDYYGYSPIDYAKDDMGNDVLVFDTRQEAADWIEQQEDGIYCLSHNEAGRPNYTIVEA
jgi:hypothetical protein